ncbi:MAG: hypothetical protein KHW88_03695 [Lachnospiraceae bacterium]|nr:hypothetical protein [Lachnospiraceae bacterium]DAJ86823.1 MAG TPA: immunity protein [Bacteriophage sp.]
MDIIIFLLIYLVILVAVIGFEIYVLFNNKGQYLKTSYKALENICKLCDSNNTEVLAREINRFYEEYVQEDAQTKKFFPNVVVWIDAIIFRIDCGYKHASILKEYENSLKCIRDELETKNPFNKCEKYQQDILRDISKIKTNENEIIVQNIIKRTEDEFIRLSTDIRKNSRSNKISITLGVAGIVVSIIMALIKF